jgi:hypothetical protein
MADSTGAVQAAAQPLLTQDVKPNVIRRPSLIMKPAQTPPAASPPPNSAGALSLTSKEWVIPPRPKPGRKPATDTPPSKRKAQNRAAQRAFRERRAARVNELEDQIKQIEDDNDKETDALQAKVVHLEKEVEYYRADVRAWADRCRRLEAELNDLRSARAQVSNDSRSDPQGDTSVGCGKCTLESRCQCIDEAFDTIGAQEQEPTSHGEKRRLPEHADGSGKRIKTEPHESHEIDFTAMFSKKPLSTSRTEHVSTSTARAVADHCGFCSDGTPCICAEMAAEQEAAQSAPARPAATSSGLSRREIPQMSQFTPPPSEGDVSLPPQSVAVAGSESNPCANGPGTCAQCRADPNSTLFCKSLAASRAQNPSEPSGGCCGGRDASGGCCQSTNVSTEAVPLPSRKTRAATRAKATPSTDAGGPSTTARQSVTLTCADAYITLSRHPAYEQASAEITSWMPKLHAADSRSPDPGAGKGPQPVAARPAMEIDAANVMAVLRDFDRRFGRNG